MADLNFPIDSAIVSEAMRAILDCLVIIDHQGRIIEFNAIAEKVFGYRRSDVIGKPIVGLIIPERFRTQHLRGMAHYLKMGECPVLNRRFETTAMRAYGAEFPVELAIVPAGDPQNPIFISFIRDISERKNAEQEMRSVSARLRQLVSNLQGGVLLENESRHIELVNPTFCQMFNIPAAPELLIGVDCSQSAEQSKHLFVDPVGFVQRIGSILKERKTVLGDILHLVDGRVFERDYVPIMNQEEYLGHLWHYRDVTHDFRTRRRWEQLFRLEELNKEIIRLFLQSDDINAAINQTLAMTGQLLDVSRVYVFHFHANERLLDNTHEWCAPGINPEIDNLKGLPFDEIVPSFFPMLAKDGIIAPRHINELPDDVRGILEPQNVKTVLILPLYSGGRIEGFVGYDETRHAREWLPEEITTVRIITESYSRALERQQVQEMLIEARDAALHTAQLRSQFVANMSHEIRTPMTGVLGMLELLKETTLDEEQTEFAEGAYESAYRLLRIVNDILDFSKLEAGQVILESEAVDLKAIASEVIMTLSPQITLKPLTFELDAAPDVPARVLSDPTRLRQVLMNLVGNAIKFTDSGTITIRIRATPIQPALTRIRVEVSDTGIGIAPEHLERIFESFVQVDGTATRRYGGSGLGLAISKQLVELMGGTMIASSVRGQGSTFGFTMAMPILASSSENPQQERFARLNALVIDSENTARYVLAQQLHNWGVQVTELNDLQRLPRLLTKFTPRDKMFDIVFLREKAAGSSLPNIIQHLENAAKEGTIRLISRIVDEPPQELVLGEFTACLERPIRQSDLYNVLVRVTHPVVEQPQSSTPIPETRSIQSKRVLLAEDYPLNVNLVKYALAELAIDLDVVEDGQAALDQLNQARYDLVLMDMQMPVMDGREATRQIRASSSDYHNIPVLALTASVMPEEQETYMLLGVNGIITKPFSINELRETVEYWLNSPTVNVS